MNVSTEPSCSSPTDLPGYLCTMPASRKFRHWVPDNVCLLFCLVINVERISQRAVWTSSEKQLDPVGSIPEFLRGGGVWTPVLLSGSAPMILV